MPAERSIAPQQQERIRTLVVDDSPAALRTICSCLEDQPAVHVVATANGGPEGLSLAEELKPDLVLLDLQMPRMNGLQVAAQLSKEFPSMLLVIVTGVDATSLRARLNEWGVSGLVTKQHMTEEFPQLFNRILPRAHC
jgi:CheY-like chemotaxis protein